MTRGRRINSVWQEKMLDLLKINEPFLSEIISFNKAAQWLIVTVANKGYTPKVENLGAGVKRISIKGSCCPTCGKPL